MKILIQIKAIFLGLFLLIFALFPVCLIAIPFPLKWRLKLVCPIWELFSRAMLTLGCHANVDIQEDHRSEEFKGVPPSGLYIANHQSYLDIPLLQYFYQAPPIMKKEVLYIPIFGWLGWISGAMPVSRSSSSSRKKVFVQAKKRLIQEKIGLQVYPEGTRSKIAHPKPYEEIKKPLLVFAFNEKIPVIATSIYGTRSILSDKGLIRPGKHVGIIVHKEIYPRDFNSADEFAKAAWEKVIQGYDQMRSRLESLNEN